MSNTLLTPSVIAREALMQLENNLVMGNLVHREYKKEFVKVGDTVSIRKPVKFEAKEGADITNKIQDVTETSVSFVIDKRFNVAFQFASVDWTLTVEKFSERYILPAGIALANKVDNALCELYKDVFFAAGAAGTTPATFLAIAQTSQKMNEAAVPRENRRLVINPAAEASLTDALKGLFLQRQVAEYVEKGRISVLSGLDIYCDQNVFAHTKGVATGTPLINGGSQTGASLATDGWTNSTTGILKKGDIFTIAAVYAVNPVSKQSTGSLQQFTVTADANSGATTGPATLSISPSIVTSGAYQTVSASPADGAEITVVANHTANLAFHRNAFGLVTVPLEMPEGAVRKARESHNGLSIRFVGGYDVLTDISTFRFDILFGTKTIYPELSCRLLG